MSCGPPAASSVWDSKSAWASRVPLQLVTHDIWLSGTGDSGGLVGGRAGVGLAPVVAAVGSPAPCSLSWALQ